VIRDEPEAGVTTFIRSSKDEKKRVRTPSRHRSNRPSRPPETRTLHMSTTKSKDAPENAVNRRQAGFAENLRGDFEKKGIKEK